MAARLPPAERFLPVLPTALWRSRRDLRYALDVLRHGVCDGCSLGSHGLHGEVQEGIHLCRERLDELERWTRGALHLDRLPALDDLRRFGAQELRSLGRIPEPLLRRTGEDCFKPIQWDDANKLLANRLGAARQRWSLLVDSHSNTNEGYFVLGRLAAELEARSSALVAAPGYGKMQSALGNSLGVAASTCSLSDILATDLVVVWGGELQGQPLLASWLRRARASGVDVVLVGEQPEPGLEYWKEHLALPPSGASEFICGVLKAGVESSSFDADFLAGRVRAGGSWSEQVARWQWNELEQTSTVSRQSMQRLARLLSEAESAVFIASEAFAGGDATARCKALLALLLAGGFVGRAGCGILALGGGAGGQGAYDSGFEAYGPLSVDPLADDLVLYVVGTALEELLSDTVAGSEAASQVPVRLHQAHYLDPSMLLDAGELTLVLPMQSRYEQRGGGTATSVDRWLRFSPEVRGHPIGTARPDWQVPSGFVAQIPELFSEQWLFQDSASVREAMEAMLPRYLGIVELHAPGHRMQWGGRSLHGECFATEDGLAQLSPGELR